MGASRQLPDVPGSLDRWDAHRSWGTALLVDTLVEVTDRLAWDYPQLDPITVGDLSTRGGGPMFGHKTHNLGIDADLGLFVHGGRQLGGFVHIPSRQLDVASTWALIHALLDTGNVQFILIDQHHINRIRDYLLNELHLELERVNTIFVPPHTRLSADRRGVVRHAPNHSSHLHVRITPAPLPPSVN